VSSLVLTLRETLRYRGAIGQWSWVLHRLTGLGVVFFLVLHVIDTSWAVFYPGLYEKAVAIYQSPLFTLGEFGLVFAVVYHALNGLRIGIMDNKPELWKYQERAAYIVLGATAVILVPTFLAMGYHVVVHYETGPEILSPITALVEQLPFIAGMVIAIIASVILSGLYGVVMKPAAPQGSAKGGGSQLERFWWSFMRVSGLLIVPLVFGHLAMIHIVQGVFDLTVAGKAVVGTNAINVSGTATEFVMQRWSFLLGGVAIWKLYDIALLALVTVHGFNGLRYVLTDYTQDNPTLRRAMGYLCVIGAVTLLVVGGAALLGTIEPEAIELAKEASKAIHR
jgi:succinate dehydrogenase / fumarate reductase cytochrome b subunit